MSAADLYPQCMEWGWWCAPGSYDPIVRSLGEVVIQMDDEDYQGDINVVLRGLDGRVGFVRIGYGSCSGCDALQACGSYAEVDALVEHISASVRWFDNMSDLRSCVCSEKSGSFWEQSGCWPGFVAAVLALPEGGVS